MTEPTLPKAAADRADAVVDRILDLIDAEPDADLRLTLLRRARTQDWLLDRRPPDPANPLDGGAYVVRFGELREYVVPLLKLPRRRLDA